MCIKYFMYDIKSETIRTPRNDGFRPWTVSPRIFLDLHLCLWWLVFSFTAPGQKVGSLFHDTLTSLHYLQPTFPHIFPPVLTRNSLLIHERSLQSFARPLRNKTRIWQEGLRVWELFCFVLVWFILSQQILASGKTEALRGTRIKPR